MDQPGLPLPAPPFSQLRESLVALRLAAVHAAVRSSSSLVYYRLIGMQGTEVRILLTVGRLYEMGKAHLITSTQIINLLGQEKSQLSRAVSRLVAEGLIRRPHLRGPLEPTAAGWCRLAEIDKIAEPRERRIVEGLDAPAVEFLSAAIERMTIPAIGLLHEARQRYALDTPDEEDDLYRAPMARAQREEALKNAVLPLERRYLLPPLIRLATLLSRSALLSFRHLGAISNFKWLALAVTAEQGPLPLLAVIEAVGRDKSQVGRAVKQLIEAGLITRSSGRRDIVLSLTPAGQEIFTATAAEMRRRDARLLSGFSADEVTRLSAILASLQHSAELMLAEERAAGGGADEVIENG